jgi:uncharacterized protein YigE (DUF2233 family)
MDMKKMMRGISFAWLALLLSASHALPSEPIMAPTNHIRRGFSYFHEEIPQGPWSIHVLKVDRHNPAFELHTALAKGNHFGLATLSEQIKTLPSDLGRPVAAINGDYYRNDGPYTGDPKGLQIMRGELISGPCDWTCFYVDTAGNPQMTNVSAQFEIAWPNGQKTPFTLNEERSSGAVILFTTAVGASTHTSGGVEMVLECQGTGPWLPLQANQKYSARIREMRKAGDARLTSENMIISFSHQALVRQPFISQVSTGSTCTISTSALPNLAGVKTAIGGGPALVRNGKITSRKEANVRHPRTAIGWNADYFFMVAVDGRQINLSVGMTFQELADYLIKLGCNEAMSLDGGGSATCWAYGQIMNNPSEGHERGMANSLVVVRKEMN